MTAPECQLAYRLADAVIADDRNTIDKIEREFDSPACLMLENFAWDAEQVDDGRLAARCQTAYDILTA